MFKVLLHGTEELYGCIRIFTWTMYVNLIKTIIHRVKTTFLKKKEKITV